MIYLATPYSHPEASVRESRFQAALDLATELTRSGELVYSPICHSHPMAEQGLPGDWAFWAEHNRWMLGSCSALWVLTLTGWEESHGVTAEIEIAQSLGMPIRYGRDLSKDGVA